MIGRLLIWEEWAVGLTNSVAFGVGYWDDGGDWHAYGDSFSEHEWRPMLWSLVRLSERAQAHTKVPALLTHRGTTNVDGRGGGLADLQLGFRYEVVQIGEYLELPSLALTTSVLAPTGRSMDQAQALLGADATGRGAWVLAFGASIEKTRMPWFAQLDASATVPVPFERSDTGLSQWNGPGVHVALTGGAQLVADLVLSTRFRLSWEAPLSIDGDRVDGSARADVGIGTGLSWLLHPHWTLIGSADTGIFANDFGDNLPGRLSASLGLRYGHF